LAAPALQRWRRSLAGTDFSDYALFQ